MKMGLQYRAAGFALCLILLVVATIPQTSQAMKGWGWGWTHVPTKTIVGGSQHWRFGFNYTNWALQTGPFYQNDTLVFMYDPPNSTTFPHSVYLVKDYRSFMTCNLNRTKLVASVVQGGGTGFEYVLKESKPYYFVCAEHEGIHCSQGLMKFIVWPLPRCYGWRC
ncbi:uncharacterized protein LOC143858046 [Tasmannia lanceolata]|uniref:uncharacterized protein LOC143858046 n=1 Tax=Tasmannia lanceolata TaxID=3420 RepID=UPI004062D8BB